MPEETLSNEERLAILSKVVAKQKENEVVTETKKEVTKVSSTTPLASLLEMSLKKQAKFQAEDKKITEEARKEILGQIKPRFDILKGWRM